MLRRRNQSANGARPARPHDRLMASRAHPRECTTPSTPATRCTPTWVRSRSPNAAHLGVTRVTLSRLLNGNSGISAEMALKLSEAFATSPELWINLQTQYDLWQAAQAKRRKVRPIARRRLEASTAGQAEAA